MRITVLISGGGTTLRNLLDHQQALPSGSQIIQVISSNSQSPGLALARGAGIAAISLNPRDYHHSDPTAGLAAFSQEIFKHCRKEQSDLIVCAGFLKKLIIPDDFWLKSINIHPSLLPAFGGAGMYGLRVHAAALAAGVKLSGCTVHFVDNQYDQGPIIAQSAVPVLAGDTPVSLAARVFAAECELYPRVIRWLAEGRVRLRDNRVEVI
ncbi:MAG: phosphoribosylglycinamide formyltransferase [Pirellulales bacterium]|nr:phosphoribosylglycinamide formyltransferase [Pirellulales bacterium]